MEKLLQAIDENPYTFGSFFPKSKPSVDPTQLASLRTICNLLVGLDEADMLPGSAREALAQTIDLLTELETRNGIR